MTQKKKKKKWYVFLKKRGIVLSLLAVLVILTFYSAYLYGVIRKKFDGQRWDLPAVVYARPLELYKGLYSTAEQLEKELQLAGYRRDNQPNVAGGYKRLGREIRLVTRDFHFPDGLQKSIKVTILFSQTGIQSIYRTDNHEELPILRLDPARIGSFHPIKHEDRIVLTHSELPDLLIKTLLAVEDRDFYSHCGLSPKAILRAIWTNLKARKTLQGGSTLTQQLVKNFFLTNKRTLWRKFNEAIMALLLELHYSKDEILTAYTNEIFLGQDGNRAIHGFALASQFYFRRNLADLDPARIALLVGLVKGPSYYHPVRHADRCRKRRKLVLDIMWEQSLLNKETYEQEQSVPVGDSEKILSGFNRFPAFLDLVRRQLTEDYHEKDLTSDGLKIFTTLNPQIQGQVEKHLAQTLDNLEKESNVKKLEGAVIVTNRHNGEILAVSGGRNPLQNYFNRAVDAVRPVGSLIKPAVYLAALQNGKTLLSPVDDSAITVTLDDGNEWQPKNFDRIKHGRIALYQALTNSYNLATVRLGMDIGLEKVAEVVKKLGIKKSFPPYPSLLLGAISLSPLEISGMYQTLAAGGFFIPQRVIGSVLAADDNTIKRFSLSVEQRFSPEHIFLLNTVLQNTVREGTGKSLANFVPSSQNVAGKTGTSNDLRDSWFAGFTNNRMILVWVGRDDNKPTCLTGATGALKVWGEIAADLPSRPLHLTEPPGIKWVWFNPETLEKSSRFANNSRRLPFIAGELTDSDAPRPPRRIKKKGLKIFETIRNWFRR